MAGQSAAGATCSCQPGWTRPLGRRSSASTSQPCASSSQPRASRRARSRRSSRPASSESFRKLDRPDQLAMLADRVAVGHSGDEVADRPQHRRPGRPPAGASPAAAGADRRDRRRTGGRRPPAPGRAPPSTGGALYIRAWRKRFSTASSRAMAGENPASGRPAARTSSTVSDSGAGQPPRGLVEHVADHQADLVADQLGHQPRFLDVGESGRGPRPRRARSAALRAGPRA